MSEASAEGEHRTEGELSAEAHRAKSKETLRVIKEMEVALGENSNEMANHFHESFHWMGNYGCGTKSGLQQFRDNWQLPLREAFTDRTYKTEKFLVDGDWASCFGHIEATHSSEFMGVPATGKRVKIGYMDFWEVSHGRIKDNWVSVDYASVLAQLGVDVFNGEGWEAFDSGDKIPKHPGVSGEGV